MSYQKLFRQAYLLTVHNPMLWLFGLVLLGGFNLSLVNFAALVPNSQWNTWPVPMSIFYGLDIQHIVLFGLALIASFLVVHVIKIAFIVIAHNLIHDSKQYSEQKSCRLCLHQKDKSSPYLLWWLRAMAISVITIILTAGVSIVVNALLNQAGRESTAAIVINLIFLIIVTCVIGTWSAFSSFFVVLHDLNFQAAISSAFDLLIMHFRRVIEFVVILSAIYTLAVIIGNVFISAWQHGGILDEARAVFLIAFVIWFAANNTFFNLAFLLFFDSTVKATPAEAAEPLPQTP